MKHEVGMVIKVCRQHCNFKQDYVAFHLGLNVNSYANIENGRVDIGTGKLYALAQLFGLKAHQILALAEEIIENGEHNWISSVVNRMIRKV